MKPLYLRTLYILTALFFATTILLWISIPDELTLDITVTVVSFSLLFAVLVFDHKKYRTIYETKTFHYLVNSFFSAFLLFLILGVLNYLFFKHPFQIDLTKDQKNSITTQSQSVAKSINGPLKIKILGRKNEIPSVVSLVELYRFYKSDISIEKFDIELVPAMAEQYGVVQSPSIVLEYQNRSQTLIVKDELSLTNALIKISRQNSPLILYSKGHGELSLESKERDGGAKLKEILQNSSLLATEVNLLQDRSLLSNAKLLILWGPTAGYSKEIIADINSYLQKGGHLLVALDLDLNGEKQTPLILMLETYGIGISNNLVIDTKSNVNGSNGTIPLAKEYDSHHLVTERFEGPTFFPIPRAITKIDLKEDRGVLRFLTMSSLDESYAELDKKQILAQKFSYDKGTDLKGPFPLVLIWEEPTLKNGTAIGVVATSTLVQNAYAFFPNNFTLVHNLVSYLSDEKDIVSFNLAGEKQSLVFISRPEMGVVFYFSVLFVPLFLSGISIMLFIRRRKL